ncbi:MAG TPA: hypothetical protein VF026_13450 [Ktedonobacteraceae bacterium]
MARGPQLLIQLQGSGQPAKSGTKDEYPGARAPIGRFGLAHMFRPALVHAGPHQPPAHEGDPYHYGHSQCQILPHLILLIAVQVARVLRSPGNQLRYSGYNYTICRRCPHLSFTNIYRYLSINIIIFKN